VAGKLFSGSRRRDSWQRGPSDGWQIAAAAPPGSVFRRRQQHGIHRGLGRQSRVRGSRTTECRTPEIAGHIRRRASRVLRFDQGLGAVSRRRRVVRRRRQRYCENASAPRRIPRTTGRSSRQRGIALEHEHCAERIAAQVERKLSSGPNSAMPRASPNAIGDDELRVILRNEFAPIALPGWRGPARARIDL